MAAGVKVTVIGVPQVLRRLRWTPAEAQKLRPTLKGSADRILANSDQEVPVRFGNLRASGKVKGPSSIQFGFGVAVEVEYGGRAAKGGAFPRPDVLRRGAVDYAIPTHEGESSRPKYLERPFNAEAPDVPGQVLRAVLGIFASARLR